ncbi:hypothetical protein HDR61_03285 [bacterium]|nr:hypothetical protein [bacterium]
MILRFFTGLIILGVMLLALGGAAAVFDITRRTTIETYFFAPNNLSAQRIEMPLTAQELGPAKMRQMLVERYVTEYFYVIPDVADAERRMDTGSTLDRMSMPHVFKQWVRGPGAQIRELAAAGVFRTVRVTNDIYKPDDSDFWVVHYELSTWARPNNMREEPEYTTGTILLKIDDTNMMELRTDADINNFIESGQDPASIFRFGVLDIAQERG